MSRVKEYTVTGTAANNASFAAAQNTTAGTPLTLAAGATSATLAATPRELTLTSTAADFSGGTFTVVGLDRAGNSITETITGPGVGLTVQGRKVYSRITSITPSASIASNVSAGFPQRICTPWVLIETIKGKDAVPTGQMATEIISGTPDASVENTYENFMRVSGDGAYVQASTDTTPPAVSSVQGVGYRGVCTSTSGTIKFRFVRPQF